jgi:hypothetical protein
MPLTIENAGALVPGVKINQKEEFMNMVQVKVLKSFYFAEKPLEKDSIVTLPEIVAKQAIYGKRAELYAEPQRPPVRETRPYSPGAKSEVK